MTLYVQSTVSINRVHQWPFMYMYMYNMVYYGTVNVTVAGPPTRNFKLEQISTYELVRLKITVSNERRPARVRWR